MIIGWISNLSLLYIVQSWGFEVLALQRLTRSPSKLLSFDKSGSRIGVEFESMAFKPLDLPPSGPS